MKTSIRLFHWSPRILCVLAISDSHRHHPTHHVPVPRHTLGRRERSSVVHLRRGAGVQSRRVELELREVHMAHQPRHVRQDFVRRPQEQCDADGDAGVPGFGRPGAGAQGAEKRDAPARRPRDAVARVPARTPRLVAATLTAGHRLSVTGYRILDRGRPDR